MNKVQLYSIKKKRHDNNNTNRLDWKIDKLLIAVDKLLRRLGG